LSPAAEFAEQIFVENLPIKIVVYDNGKLGFVDIEQKASGLVSVYETRAFSWA